MSIALDIILKHEIADFHYRVAGVILSQERILLQQVKGWSFWFLPGGHGAIFESSQEALKREIREELNTDVKIGRLVWVIENFYKLKGKSRHELGLYYLVEIPTNSPLGQIDNLPGKDGEINQFEMVSRWYNLRDIANINLVPSCLKVKLVNIPEHTEHIVHRDNDFL
jgi:8-oxo-dGTP pyrophosphatase MutT (NUDIX family)